MKKPIAIVGAAAACAACCAIPVIFPLLAGAAVSGLTMTAVGWELAVWVVIAAAVMVVVIQMRRKAHAAPEDEPSSSVPCACDTACSVDPAASTKCADTNRRKPRGWKLC